LPGAAELLAEGLESMLAPANRTVARDIELGSESAAGPRLAPLFDPQTCGGLIFGVPPDQVQDMLARLAQSPTPAAVIGRIVTPSTTPLVRLA
jgi:selenide,water dikinase